MLLVQSLIPRSRFVPDVLEIPVCSSWNQQAKHVPSLENSREEPSGEILDIRGSDRRSGEKA